MCLARAEQPYCSSSSQEMQNDWSPRQGLQNSYYVMNIYKDGKEDMNKFINKSYENSQKQWNWMKKTIQHMKLKYIKKIEAEGNLE